MASTTWSQKQTRCTEARFFFVGLAILAVSGCEPTVKLSAPDKPFVINLNVKIECEVWVKIEREINDVIRENKEIF
jgi:hypothetical protein